MTFKNYKMFKKVSFLIVVLLFVSNSFSQKNINDYKYVVVAKKFDFLKKENQYRVNELLEFLFNKNGYTAFLENEEYPQDLKYNPCKAMYATLNSLGGLLTTKLQIEITDCDSNIIVKSSVGKSKEKAFNKVYALATRKAFESITFLNYKYNGKADENTNEGKVVKTYVTTKQDIAEAKAIKEKEAKELARLKAEVEALKQQKAQAEAQAEQAQAEKEAALLEVEKAKDAKSKKSIYNAKATKNGYQLFNSISKLMEYELIKTAAPNVYIVKGKDAIVFKEDNKWIFSKGETKHQLNIKF